MNEFKGTRGEVEIAKKFQLEVVGEYDSKFTAIPIFDATRNIVLVPTDFEMREAKHNANLIIDAFKVRQAINCELSELLEQNKEMLEMLEEVRKFFRSRELEQLIKKVKHNGKIND
jgi:hypothetical protein